MRHSLTVEHRQAFEDLKKKLTATGVKEGNFVKVELLFYDAISIARTYGDDVEDNALLAAFKELQADQYLKAKALFKKSSQREQAIRRFVSRLKLVLGAATKNAFLSLQPAC